MKTPPCKHAAPLLLSACCIFTAVHTALAATMASQPWVTNRIAEAEARLSAQITAATNAIPKAEIPAYWPLYAVTNADGTAVTAYNFDGLNLAGIGATASDAWQMATDALGGLSGVARASTNYTEAVASEFVDGTREVATAYSSTVADNAENARFADEAETAQYLLGGFDKTERWEVEDLLRASTNAALKVVGSATNGLPEAIGRKQDALPYPTNAIPYAAISGAPPEMGALDKMWEFQLSGYGETAKARGRIIGVSGTTAMVYCQLYDTSNIEWTGLTTYYLFSMVIEFNSDAYTILSRVADGSSFSNVVATLYFADAYSIMTGTIPSTTEIEYNTVLFKAVR